MGGSGIRFLLSVADIKEINSRGNQDELDYHEGRHKYLERRVLCLMAEDLHSKERSQSAEAGGKQKKGLLRDPPAALFGLAFVDTVKNKGDNGH